ncbi:MAG: leucine--tRNA ligase [Bdellovibrionales bacterium]
MTERYNPKTTEPKWQEIWAQKKCFNAQENNAKKKFYALIEFPYPSGEGLHVGHPRSYTALDIVSRKRRMEGYNVLFPIGWDAFGLPTENFAIKTGQHPKVVTQKNIANFRRQLKSLGFSFDWSREVDTTDPAYYKWTQWIFLKLWEKGLAYKTSMPVNWCPSCKVGLANEEVVGGGCERCGGIVVQRQRSQWMLKITAYAERLLSDLDTVDYLEKIKVQQRNWIGKSIGAEVDFTLPALKGRKLRIFTTRPDTLFGVTYMVLAPEHPLVQELMRHCKNGSAVRAYIEATARKSDFDRTEGAKEVSGVVLEGVFAQNPATKKDVPVWIADYVLATYGTGAIMAVPAHDERDWRFAKKFKLPIIEVIAGGDVQKEAYISTSDEARAVNSGPLDGLKPSEAIAKMIDIIKSDGYGTPSIKYKLRDWVFSRQRYWGEPIPMVDCSKCGWVPLPESELPLRLPEVESYQTSETGESPLSLMTDWVNVKCPKCGGKAKRETDTMPQWAGSSWYFLRYCDPHNDKELASRKALEFWTPIDWYNGGMEHTVLHLLYSRFWHKFLYDIGTAPTPEPYARRTSHGLILGENNEKMSKSRGNVVNPDEVVETHGADTLRLYEMFMGPFDQAIPWSTNGLTGMWRFLSRLWALSDKVTAAACDDAMTRRLHRAAHEVDERIEAMKFNTAIASLMSLTNDFGEEKEVPKDAWEMFLKLLSPFAPHIAEEMWQKLGNKTLLAETAWPKADAAMLVEDTVTIAVQVNGKLRATINVARDLPSKEVEALALAEEGVKRALDNKAPKKVIVVPNRIVNVVV